MPVNSQHPEYKERFQTWKDMDQICEGIEAIRCDPKRHIPMLKDQPEDEYKAMVLRGVLFEATGRTHEAYSGMCTRKAPEIKLPDNLATFRDNVDGMGMDLNSYIQLVISKTIKHARFVTLVNWNEKGQPYLTTYNAAQFINWNVETINGANVLTFAMLEEWSTKYEPSTGDDPPDEYETTMYKQWREIRATVVDGSIIGVEVKVWRMKKKNAPGVKEEFVQIGPTVELTRRALPIPAIPLIVHTSEADDPLCTGRPMLTGIMHINYAHLRNSVDIENGRHLCGLPTAWTKCFELPDQKTLTLGSQTAWSTDNINAECGYLELSGTGLKTLSDGMEEKEQQMAALGARALEPKDGNVEAFATVALRSRAETASLVTVIEQSNRTISQVLQWCAWILGTKALPSDHAKEAYLVLSKDIAASKMPSDQLVALLQAFQTGAISFQTFFYNLQQGEMYPDGTTEEAERTALTDSPLPPPVDPNTPPGAPSSKPKPAKKPFTPKS